MGLVLKILLFNSVFVLSLVNGSESVYENLNSNASLGVNCSETLEKLVTNVDYSVEDFTDYTQDQEEPNYPPDVPKSRHSRSIRRVLSWVGRGFNKVFNSPYIYNFYPIINYSVGKIMQHLPFLNNNPSNPSPASPDYPQSSSQPNPQQLQQQQQMQQEYEEQMEKKQQELQRKQQEAEERAKHAAEEKKLINERAKKLAAKYVELYFSKHATTPVPFPSVYNQGSNFGSGAAYIAPAVAPVYNPPVYDQAYAQPNYPAAYPAVDNVPEPEVPVPEPIPPVYNPPPPAAVKYVNVWLWVQSQK